MTEENKIIEQDEARQGRRILGMPSTLGYGMLIALIGMVVLFAILR